MRVILCSTDFLISPILHPQTFLQLHHVSSSMSFEFVTEVLAEKPQVVVVSQSAFFSAELENELQNNNLEVVLFEPTDIKNATKTLTEAYKIIWLNPIVSAASSQTTTQTNLKTLTVLKPFQHKLLVVANVDSTINNSSKASNQWWEQLQQQHTFITNVITHFPAATVLVGSDIFFEKPVWYVPQVFNQAFCNINQGGLWDPQMELYPQTWGSFIRHIATQLLKPDLTSQLIRGRKIHTTAFLKMLQLHAQRIFGTLPRITPLPPPTPVVLKLPTTTTIHVESSEVFIKALIPLLKSFKAQSTPLSPTKAAPTHITHVEPTKTPVKKPIVAKSAPPTIPAIKRIPPRPPNPEVGLEADLTQLFNHYRSGQKVQEVQQVVKTTVKTKRKVLHRRKLFWAGVVVIGLAVGVGSIFSLASVAAVNVRQNLLITAQAAGTSQTISSPTTSRFWASMLSLQQMTLGRLINPSSVKEGGALLRLSNALSVLSDQQSAFSTTGNEMVLASTGRGSGDMRTLVSQLGTQSQTLYQSLSQAQADLKQLLLLQPDADQKAWSNFETKLSEQKKQLSWVTQLQTILPDLIGFNGKKTYALVFQNNQELRPLGGLIQAVGIVTLDQGLVIDSQVLTISSTPNLATATSSASPTKPTTSVKLNTLLTTPPTTLADSAWLPDAPAASKNVLVAIEKETTKNIDGVIFFNNLVLEDWIKAVGPLEIPELNEVVTDKNLSDRFEAHSGLQVPQNKNLDYSSLVLQRLLQRTTQISPEKIPQLLAVWSRHLEGKQLLIVPRQDASLSVFNNLGWSGALFEPACPPSLQQERCLVDVLTQVESNVGENKANIYVQRSMTHQVEVSPNAIHHTHQISIKNQGTSNTWPRGTYKTYVRLYVSPTARLEGLTVNQQALSPENTVMSFENNRQVFGAYVEVPIQETMTLKFEYLLPVSPTSPFSYALFTQLQPGLEVPDYQVSINSVGFRPTLVAPLATIEGSQITFKPSTSLHSLVGAKFE